MTTTLTSKSTASTWIDRATVAVVILAAPLVIAIHAATANNTHIGHDAVASHAHHGSAAHFYPHPGHGPQ